MRQMKQMDVLMEWWADPEANIIRAGETAEIITWLGKQDPETWHNVVMTWNYDYGDEVLTWVLNQDSCDRGTAARIFMVEGFGHWLGDPALAQDKKHICNVVLDNWHRYKTGNFSFDYTVTDQMREQATRHIEKGLYPQTPLSEIVAFTGTRAARSKYAAEDGKIVIDLDYWMAQKGIELIK